MSDLKNDFRNPNSYFNTVLTDLNKRKRVLRFGEWTTEEENVMLLKFVHDRQEAIKERKDPALNNDYNINFVGENAKYVDNRFANLSGNYDKLYQKVAQDVAAMGTDITDTAYLAATLKVINDFIPLKGSPREWQENADIRAKLLHNVNRIFGLNSYLISAYNEETEQNSLFVAMQGTCKSSVINEDVDGWQIVNPAAVSIVTIGTYDMFYPNRAFISDSEFETFSKNTSKFETRFDAPADNSHIFNILNDSARAIATVKNIGNLDFSIKDMKKINTKEQEMSQA